MIVSDTSVNQRTTVFVLAAIIVATGLLSYLAMPRESAPEVIIPNVFITTNYRGVSPQDIETSITREIEEQLKGLKNVKEVSSTSTEGRSFINVEFVTGTDIDDALQKVKDKVDLAKSDLPGDLDQDPIVDELNISEMPILVLGLSGDIGLKRLRDIAEDLEEIIEGVPGVLEVDVTGGLEREIQIEIDPNRMMLYDVPFSALGSVVSSENANISGGSIRTSVGKYQLRLEGEFDTAEEAEQIVVATGPDESPVYLRDIAVIRDGFKDVTSLSRLNGRSAVNLQVKKRSGENIVRIIEEVDAILEREQATWPAGVEITRLDDRADDIRMMIVDLENNIVTGLLLVIVVVFFAMGLRNAVLVSLSIPLSMLLGFIVLGALGITLNMVVLFSLTLALGMLVDNAIVIIENIYRFMQQGVGRLEAAKRATSEVAYPVIGSALTTIAAFTPLLWWSGIMGDFMVYLPATVITLLASCLFVAMVINPALAAVFMRARVTVAKPKTADEVTSGGEHPMLSGGGPVTRTYRKILAGAIGANIPQPGEVEARGRFARAVRRLLPLLPRFAVLGAAVLVLVFCIMLWLWRTGLEKPMEFFPSIDPDRATVSLEMPEGADLEYCDGVVREVEKSVFSENYAEGEDLSYRETLQPTVFQDNLGGTYRSPSDIEYIETAYSRVDSMGGANFSLRGGSSNEVTFLFIDYERRNPDKKSHETLDEIAERVKRIAGARITTDRNQDGPPTGKPINIEISGNDMETLGRLSRQVEEVVRRVSFVRNIKNDFSQGAPTLEIRVDRQRAAFLGLNSQLIGFALRSAINGTEVSTYRENDEDYDIVMRFKDADRHSIDTLTKIFIPSPSHGQVPLSTVAEIRYVGGYGEINRVDFTRVVTVEADVDPTKTTGDTAATQARQRLEGSPLFVSTRTLAEGIEPAEAAGRLRGALPSELFPESLLAGEGLLARLFGGTPKAERELALPEEEDEHLNAVVGGLNELVRTLDPEAHAEALEQAVEARAEGLEAGRAEALRGAFAYFRETPPSQQQEASRKLLDALLPSTLRPMEPGLEMPAGYAYRFTGEQENQRESSEFLSVAGAVAVALIFLVLVTQFNSVVYPFIILSSVILSLAGVFLGLAIYDESFGLIMSGVGVISLAGVVVNNAIVLIDYTLQLQARGMARNDAVIAAGATRLRPVILTAITTVLGLVPMVTGYSIDFHPLLEGSLPVFQSASESSMWWKSMAICVIFGLFVATAMTLVVVPVLFTLADDLSHLGLLLWRKFCERCVGLGRLYWRMVYGILRTNPRPGEPFGPSNGKASAAEAGEA